MQCSAIVKRTKYKQATFAVFNQLQLLLGGTGTDEFYIRRFLLPLPRCVALSFVCFCTDRPSDRRAADASVLEFHLQRKKSTRNHQTASVSAAVDSLVSAWINKKKQPEREREEDCAFYYYYCLVCDVQCSNYSSVVHRHTHTLFDFWRKYVRTKLKSLNLLHSTFLTPRYYMNKAAISGLAPQLNIVVL